MADPAVVVSGTPLRVIVYPVTPTLSVDAVHDNCTWVGEVAEAVNGPRSRRRLGISAATAAYRVGLHVEGLTERVRRGHGDRSSR